VSEIKQKKTEVLKLVFFVDAESEFQKYFYFFSLSCNPRPFGEGLIFELTLGFTEFSFFLAISMKAHQLPFW